MSVAVSTSGASPFLAGWVRRRVSEIVGDEVADLAQVLGETRAAVRSAGVSSEGLDWGGLVGNLIWPLVLAGDIDLALSAAEGWVEAVLVSASPAVPADPAPELSGIETV